MNSAFYSARLKIERAKHHINDLNLKANEFAKANPHVITIKNDIETGDDFIYITPAERLPDELLLILGDAIHNLRAALDYAWYDMALSPHDFTRFPITETKEKFVSKVNGAKGNAPENIITFLIDDVQPYEGGNGDPIWRLDCLDVTDKHKLPIAHIEYRTVTGVSGIDERGTKFSIPEWFLVHGHTARYRCVGHRNVQITDHGNAIIRVVFGKGMAFESKYIIPTLKNLTLFVSSTIDNLESVFLTTK